MTINEATKILISDKASVLICSVRELKEAQQLAIEGLLRIQMKRNTPSLSMDDLLPGETEE